MHTTFVQLHFSIEPLTGKTPPYGLFALRQHFHAAFRRVCGCYHGTSSCPAGSDCPCHDIFDQSLTTDPSALRRYQKPPLPFVFRIPVLPADLQSGDDQVLTLVIAGGVVRHLNLFVRAVRLLFSPSGFFSGWQVISLEAATVDGSRIPLPFQSPGDTASLPLLSFDDQFAQDGVSCRGVTLSFQTPLRLLHKGSPLQDIPFSVLAGALFRRISALAYYYGQEELPHDFKWLARCSRDIRCRCTDLRRVNHGGALQGVEGEISFAGELTEFLPFLRLGSLLNLGKGSAYGMGSYLVSLDA